MKKHNGISIVALLVTAVVLTFALSSCGTEEKTYTFTADELYGYTTANALTGTEENGAVSIDGIVGMVQLDTWMFTSGIPNNAITVKYAGVESEKASFDITVDSGSLWHNNDYEKSVSVTPGTTVYWHSVDDADTQKAYIKITLWVEEHIAGYAVIAVRKDGSSLDYRAELSKCAVFPKLDGAYQDITQEQADGLIAEVID